jgi:hypothetical protein
MFDYSHVDCIAGCRVILKNSDFPLPSSGAAPWDNSSPFPLDPKQSAPHKDDHYSPPSSANDPHQHEHPISAQQTQLPFVSKRANEPHFTIG